jgi:hypothetical protein
MLKDQTMQPTLLQEDFHANLSALQEKEREQMMIATSGMKLLESLPNVNRGGLLEKMLKDLLTSTTAWSSDRCKLIWKIKVSKSNVLLFQLQASVLSTSVKESGLWLTPTATDMGARSEEALQKRKEYRSKIGRNTVPPGNLAEQVHYGMATTNMYPTPAARDYKDSTISNSHQNRNSDSLPIKMMRMYGTPKAQDERAALWDRGKGNLGEQVHGENNARAIGGRLNPNFVEFLMGYPQHWTKIDPTE